MTAGGFLALLEHAADGATPTVTITPVSAPVAGGSGYQSGENVRITVGTNSVFKPGVRVNILECADADGTAANLPKSVSSCDGNTIEGNSLLVGSDGNIMESNYTIYELPNSTLGEQASWQPVCDLSHECVLYVGEDQEDFTQPKLFSSPFTVSGSAGSAGTSQSTPASTGSITASPGASAPTPGSSSTSGSSASDPGSAVTLPTSSGEGTSGSTGAQGTLANTGAPPALPWIFASGALLTLTGAFGRRLAWSRS